MANGVRGAERSGRPADAARKGSREDASAGGPVPVRLTGVDDAQAALAAAREWLDGRLVITPRAHGKTLRREAFDAAVQEATGEIRDAGGALIRAADFLPSLSNDDRAARAARLDAAKASRASAIKAGKAEMKRAKKALDRRTAPQARVQAHGFAMLAQQGSLPAGLIEAGLDIDRIVSAIEAGVMARSDADAWATGGVKASGKRGAPQFMAVEGYVDRYLPWTRALIEPGFRRGGQGGRTVLAVVIAVVCDGHSLRSLDRVMKVRKDTCMGLLCDGLREYCRVAGWKEGG